MSLPDKIVAQHNALVNARFSFEPLQMRLFLALLGRIEFEDVEFQEHLIPFTELAGNLDGGSAYPLIREMCLKLTSFTIYVERLEPVSRRRSKTPYFEFLPLMAKAAYDADQGGVVAIFNPLIIPYLLQLRESGNFTMAKLAELAKLKSPYALRIYWLLKEYAAFGERTMTVEQLRFVLDIADVEYPRFSSFKARVLSPVQKELAATDMPFTMELERRNQIVQQIKFIIEQNKKVSQSEKAQLSKQTKHVQPLGSAGSAEATGSIGHTADAASTPHAGYAEKLALAGLDRWAVKTVLTQLSAGEYAPGYVDFVLARVAKQHQLGKVVKPAGAIYKALIEKYLLEEYAALPRSTELPATGQALPGNSVVATSGRNRRVVRQACSLPEVRAAYERIRTAAGPEQECPGWEQYLQRDYYDRGFVRENYHGSDCLVLRSK